MLLAPNQSILKVAAPVLAVVNLEIRIIPVVYAVKVGVATPTYVSLPVVLGTYVHAQD
jgi:hypothetical protein